MAFCTNCGKQLDEGAKFCSTCGAAVPQTTWEENSERKTVYDGELHKCPNCGEQINSFVAVCPACGYEFRGAKTASCVKELAAKLEPVSDPEQRDDLIRNFYIPNTKEDICEFFILAVSNIKARDDCEDAWRAKLEQAYQKARLSFGNDSSFSEINKLYESVTKREPLNQFMKKRYVAFMKKYQTATDSSAMLMDYLSFMQKYNDFSEKANAYDTNEMSTADAAYYLEVTSRVSQKLLQAAS